MVIFQSSVLEAFQSLRDEFSSFQKTSEQPELEVDQTSASASMLGPSNQAVTLDPPLPRPRPTSHTRLGADQSQHDNASDQHSSLFDEPTKVTSARPKKHSHSHKKHDIELRSASDQYSGQSDEPLVVSSGPKNIQTEANTK